MPAARVTSVDSLRLFALYGICLVNLPFIAMPTERAMSLPTDTVDQAMVFGIALLVEMKFFLLFSFLYGWGLQGQFAGADAERVRREHWRRMGALAVGGALHGIFVFTGDILLIYAACGTLLWRMRDASTASRLTVARRAIGVSAGLFVVLGAIVAFLPAGASLPPQPARGFVEALTYRAREWPITFFFLLVLQGPLVVAAMLTGMSARAGGWLQDPASPLRQPSSGRARLLGGAALLNFAFAGQSLLPSGTPRPPTVLASALGMATLALAAPALAWFYLSTLLAWFEHWQPPAWLRRAGANSLSVYIFQGILSQSLMDAWGFGLYDQCNRLQLVGLSLALTTVAIVLVSAWARMAERGPLEAIMRWWVKR